MGYVGTGRGDHVEVMGYKFVGARRGEYDVLRMKDCTCTIIGSGLVCCVLITLLLMWLLLPVATTPLAFDCNAGFAYWETSWSRSKQVFCCQHAGVGCAGTTSVAPAPATSPR